MEATPATCDLSILVPFYNEEDNLAENYENIRRVLEGIPQSAEIIYVNDGSSDRGAEVVRAITVNDKRVKLISFIRNFGQTAAMEAAFKAASGRIYITLDADNQNDPADIPVLLKKLDEGFDVVSGWRKKRRDGFLFRRLPSLLANWLISRVTGVRLKDYGCTLKAYRAEYIDPVNLYGEMHRFIPAFAKFAGARITETAVNHRARTKGNSKYGLSRTLKVILDLLTVKLLSDYGTKPVYFFGGIGFTFMLAAVVINGYVLYEKFQLDIFVHKNPLFTLAMFTFLLGVILIMMGLIAELVIRTYHESQGKTIYRIREKIGFDG